MKWRSSSGEGIVELDDTSRVIQFEEKPREPFSTLAATCIYFFPLESLASMNAFFNEDHHLDVAGKYIEWLANREKVYGYVLEGEWFDIGHKDTLQHIEQRFRGER